MHAFFFFFLTFLGFCILLRLFEVKESRAGTERGWGRELGYKLTWFMSLFVTPVGEKVKKCCHYVGCICGLHIDL